MLLLTTVISVIAAPTAILPVLSRVHELFRSSFIAETHPLRYILILQKSKTTQRHMFHFNLQMPIFCCIVVGWGGVWRDLAGFHLLPKLGATGEYARYC
jgi:hypothetical protein